MTVLRRNDEILECRNRRSVEIKVRKDVSLILTRPSSFVEAPLESWQQEMTLLAVALGVAGGVVYLSEKLINLGKEVALMALELILKNT